MATRSMKRCSASLLKLDKCKWGITMRYYLTRVRIGYYFLKKIINVGKDVKKSEPLYTIDENVKWYN